MSTETDDGEGADLQRVRRWQDQGGTWRVLDRRAQQVTVSLRRCDGGEEVDRLTSSAADLLSFLGDRPSSED